METVIQKAKNEFEKRFQRLQEEADKKSGKGKLIYISRKLATYQSKIYSPVPAFNYEFKNILAIAVQNDELNKITKKEISQSFNSFKKRFGEYESLFRSTGSDPVDIQDRVLFPEEISEAAQKTGASTIREILMEDLAEEIITTALVSQGLEGLLNDALDELIVTPEDFEKLSNEYGSRIQWLGDGKELAYLFNCLDTNDWMSYPSVKGRLSDPQIATLLLAHFHVTNKQSAKKKELLLSTMTTYVKEAENNEVPEIEISKRKK